MVLTHFSSQFSFTPRQKSYLLLFTILTPLCNTCLIALHYTTRSTSTLSSSSLLYATLLLLVLLPLISTYHPSASYLIFLSTIYWTLDYPHHQTPSLTSKEKNTHSVVSDR